MHHSHISTAGPARLVAIVVTYNRLPALKTTLARLLADQEDYLQAVVVVDNASNPATQNWLAEQVDPRLVVETLSQNLGGAGGFEHGMRVAAERFDPDWLCLMDDDARPYEGALGAFFNRERPEHAYAAAVYFPDGKICEMNRPGRNPFWSKSIFLKTIIATLAGRGRFGFHIGDETYEGDTLQSVDNASFVGFFVSRDGVNLVGYPDAGLFIYGDDVMYSLSLRRAGEKVLFDPMVKFEHACTTFASEGYSVLKPIWKVYYIYRNGLWMYRLAAGWAFWLVLPIILAKWTLKGFRYGNQKKHYFFMLWHALKDGLLRRKTRPHDEVLNFVPRD